LMFARCYGQDFPECAKIYGYAQQE
jgi:hypothetical protein